MDEGPKRGVRGSVAMLAALGALLIGLAGGTALGGMLGYVAGQRTAGGDVVVPPAIERLGLLPPRPTARPEPDAEPAEARDEPAAPAAEPATEAAPEPAAKDDAAGDSGRSGSGRSKGGQQAGQEGGVHLDARPRLGVEVDTAPLAVGDYAAGARVMSVAPGSAAAAAGLEVEDVVVSVDGVAVRTSDDLAAAIAAHAAGDSVTLVVLRGEAELTFKVTLGAADASTQP